MAFWNRKLQAVLEPVAPEPVAIAAQSAEELCDYEKAVLAAGGDASSPFLLEAKLSCALVDNGLAVYDYQRVLEYLALKLANGWFWVPFSRQDEYKQVPEMRCVNPMTRGICSRWSENGWIIIDGSIYTKPVPLPVLNTITVIRNAISQARFFISDEMRPEYRDPFLMVKIPGSEICHVIERWDEPSFRG